MLSQSLTEREVWLARRLVGQAGDRGMSSDALVVSVLFGDDPSNEPLDLTDLDRCFMAFHYAPWEIKKLMLPTLKKWCGDLEAKYAEEGKDASAGGREHHD